MKIVMNEITFIWDIIYIALFPTANKLEAVSAQAFSQRSVYLDCNII